jgi:hypothetical protein
MLKPLDTKVFLFAGVVCVTIALGPSQPVAQEQKQITVGTDFDGTGHGHSYTISASTARSSSESSSSETSTSSSSTTSTYTYRDHDPPGEAEREADREYWRAYEARRRREQEEARAEEERRQAEEEARERERQRLEEELRRLEEERRLARIRRIDNIEAVRQRLSELIAQDERTERVAYNLKVKISKALGGFEQQQQAFNQRADSMLERLAQGMGRIQVPPPPVPGHYQSVLIGGLGYTPEEAREATRNGQRNPFDDRGDSFGLVLGFAAPGVLNELERVTLDHILPDFGRLSPATTGQLERLRGATVTELVAYSNGSVVAEYLIDKGIITGVKRLEILGGDGALMRLGTLEKLAEKKNLQIDVYATQGDYVPLIPTGWQIRQWADQAAAATGRSVQFDLPVSDTAKQLTYQALGLGPPAPSSDPLARVHVHYLSVPSEYGPEKRHEYWIYSSAVTAQNWVLARLGGGR